MAPDRLGEGMPQQGLHLHAGALAPGGSKNVGRPARDIHEETYPLPPKRILVGIMALRRRQVVIQGGRPHQNRSPNRSRPNESKARQHA